ncbi:MAG: PadR family transcriptional regulator [Turicibacter sp.]|nr:PadR family transcriptional regulator [Turicibacter sp.]
MRDHAKGGALTETSFYILLSLYQPNHGYGIMQFIEDTTNGRLTLGAGTLYGALKNLQKKGWITPYNDGGERKKEFIITDAGRMICEVELQRLQSLIQTATSIIKEDK